MDETSDFSHRRRAFYYHFGFDPIGLTRALLGEFGIIARRSGGSTITQQLVKNTFLSPERSYWRKFNELLLAIKVEWVYSKDEILELYLNEIPYGPTIHGVEAAAQHFFAKSARDLTILESSILASLPVAPTRFSPYGNNLDLLMGTTKIDPTTKREVWKKGRKDLVLERMQSLGMISAQQFSQAWSAAKTLTFQSNKTDIRAPHFVFWIREQLEQKYGREFLDQGGLRIYTTLNPDLQTQIEEIVETKSAGYENQYEATNVAAVVIDNQTSEVLAYLGGRDYFDQQNDGQVDVLRSPRQPGSSFKPFCVR